MGIEWELPGSVEKKVGDYKYLEGKLGGSLFGTKVLGVEFENLDEYYEKAEDFMKNFTKNKYLRAFFGRRVFNFKINEPFTIEKMVLDGLKTRYPNYDFLGNLISERITSTSFFKLGQGDKKILAWMETSEDGGKEKYSSINGGDSVYTSLVPSINNFYDLEIPKFHILGKEEK